MTIFNRSKATIISRGLTGLFIVSFFLFSLIHSQESYAEMKKVSGTSKQTGKLSDSTRYFDQTRVRLANNLYTFISADPQWDKANIFAVSYYINPTLDGDDYNGCLAITHPNGDQAFVVYEGSWKWTTPRDGYRWISETKGRFTGGTGKFKGIRGNYTSKGKGDGELFSEGEWQVEYEIVK